MIAASRSPVEFGLRIEEAILMNRFTINNSIIWHRGFKLIAQIEALKTRTTRFARTRSAIESTGRPGQGATAKHMDVKVRHALTGRIASIDNYSITALGDIHLVCNL